MTEEEKLKQTFVPSAAGILQIAFLCGDDDLAYEIVCAQDAQYYKTGLTDRQRYLLGYETNIDN